jgi:peptidyl-prolyl cis-trans isomerase-like 4
MVCQSQILQVSEGLEVLDAINDAICDDKGRPLQNIRIRHTIILDDPFPDPAPLLDHIPESSPEPVYAAVRASPVACLCSQGGVHLGVSVPSSS